jgi:hypothetical protein
VFWDREFTVRVLPNLLSLAFFVLVVFMRKSLDTTSYVTHALDIESIFIKHINKRDVTLIAFTAMILSEGFHC